MKGNAVVGYSPMSTRLTTCKSGGQADSLPEPHDGNHGDLKSESRGAGGPRDRLTLGTKWVLSPGHKDKIIIIGNEEYTFKLFSSYGGISLCFTLASI